MADEHNDAIRTVAVSDGSVGTLMQSYIAKLTQSLTQNTAGDIFVTAYFTEFRVSYAEKIMYLYHIPNTDGYRDYHKEAIIIQNNKLLVADYWNNKLTLLDLFEENEDKVTTLNLCNGCVSLDRPHSIMLTNHSLYVG